MNDADILTAQMQEAAATAEAGVCALCETPLNPLHPKWAATYAGSRITPEMDAECYGPADAQLPYHTLCLEES